MTKDIRFIKPFHYEDQLQAGDMIPEALVVYGKVPSVMRTEMIDDYTQVVIQTYKKVLYINLWLIRLRFSWDYNTT
jgi:hypothetical protein